MRPSAPHASRERRLTRGADDEGTSQHGFWCFIPELLKSVAKDFVKSRNIEAHSGDKSMVILAMIKHLPGCVCSWIREKV